MDNKKKIKWLPVLVDDSDEDDDYGLKYYEMDEGDDEYGDYGEYYEEDLEEYGDDDDEEEKEFDYTKEFKRQAEM